MAEGTDATPDDVNHPCSETGRQDTPPGVTPLMPPQANDGTQSWVAPLDIPPSPPMTTFGNGAPSFQQFVPSGSTVEELTLPSGSDDSSPKQDDGNPRRSIDFDDNNGSAEKQEGMALRRKDTGDLPNQTHHYPEDAHVAQQDDEEDEESSEGHALDEEDPSDSQPMQQHGYSPQPMQPSAQLSSPQQLQQLQYQQPVVLQTPPPQWQYAAPEWPTVPIRRRILRLDLPWDQRWSQEQLRRDRGDAWELHCQERRRTSTLGGVADGCVLVSSLVSEAWRLERRHLLLRRYKARLQEQGQPPPIGITPSTSAADPVCLAAEACVAGGKDPVTAAALAHLDAKWRRIGSNALREVRADSQPYDTVRRLANMFIFLEGKQLERYMPDNPHLQARIAAQQGVIEAICEQPGGCLFLPKPAEPVSD